MDKIILLGGGGHAKCVIETLLLQGRYTPAGILDKDKNISDVLGVPIIGSDGELESFFQKGLKLCFITIGSVGDPSKRIFLWNLANSIGFDFPNTIHPSAVVASSVVMGTGNYIGPGTIINSGVVIGDNCIVNSGAIIEHDCRIGHHVHIATGAVLSGGVVVGDAAHLGTGSMYKQYIDIGGRCVVGAGSVVVCSMPADCVCFGNPCKRIRDNG